jgi:DNA-directed RNA polymerase specialized sigma24 family protein
MQTDADLMVLARAGDRDALAAIYDRYADRVYDLCSSVLRDPDAAFDAMVDTFVLAALELYRLRKPDRLESWLFAMAREQLLIRRIPIGVDEHAEFDGEPGVAAAVGAGAIVWEAASWLPPRDRILLDLHVRQSLDNKALAAAIGVSLLHAVALVRDLDERVERLMSALLVARLSRPGCPQLQRLIAGEDEDHPDSWLRHVALHVDVCRTCLLWREHQPSAIQLIKDVPREPAPPEVREEILDRVDLLWAQLGPPDWRASIADGGQPADLTTDDVVEPPSLLPDDTVEASVETAVLGEDTRREAHEQTEAEPETDAGAETEAVTHEQAEVDTTEEVPAEAADEEPVEATDAESADVTGDGTDAAVVVADATGDAAGDDTEAAAVANEELADTKGDDTEAVLVAADAAGENQAPSVAGETDGYVPDGYNEFDDLEDVESILPPPPRMRRNGFPRRSMYPGRRRRARVAVLLGVGLITAAVILNFRGFGSHSDRLYTSEAKAAAGNAPVTTAPAAPTTAPPTTALAPDTRGPFVFNLVTVHGCIGPNQPTTTALASVADDRPARLSSVELVFTDASGTATPREMTRRAGNEYEATIGPYAVDGNINWTVAATDAAGNSTTGFGQAVGSSSSC